MAERTDRGKLDLFVEQVNTLERCRALRAGTVSTSMVVGAANQPFVSYEQGDLDDLRSALTVFRAFVAPKEDCYFETISSIVDRLAPDDPTRQANAALLKGWSGVMKGSFQLNRRSVTCREAFKLVAYGGHLHHDVRKIQNLESLGVLRPAVEWLATRALVSGLQILQAQRSMIGEVLAGRSMPLV
ncbi:hypothetical protein [Nonomuraea sp. NPDC050310]|uniref:hypothetical protein n=1 Tax=Nonomuraea sp. NPDC050310 TaxID=3154935 RepID=UPI0033C03742